MTDQTDLSAIIDGGASEDVTAQPKGTEQSPAENAQTGEPDKQEATPTPGVEKPKEKDDVSEGFKALRKHIKTLERELKAVKGRSQAEHPVPPVDIFADPEGYQRAIADNMKAIEVKTKITTSEAIAASKYEDFDEMREVFLEHATETPTIIEEMMASADPAGFAYTYAKQAKARAEIGDPVKYAEKVRAEERQRLMAEMPKLINAEVQKALAGILPQSLAEKQTQGDRATNPDGFNGPTPLSDIFKR